MNRITLGLLCATLLTPGIGCSPRPSLASVKGTVTIDGKPAGGTVVGFWPADPSAELSPKNSGGVITDDQGAFEIPAETGGGLAAGEYRVTFSRVVDGSGRPAPSAKPGESRARETLPAPYLSRTASPVTVTVRMPEAALELALTTAGMPGPPAPETKLPIK